MTTDRGAGPRPRSIAAAASATDRDTRPPRPPPAATSPTSAGRAVDRPPPVAPARPARRGVAGAGAGGDEVEQLDLGVGHEQHRRGPLHRALLDEDRLAGLRHRGVDRGATADQVGVQLLGEQDRRRVADRELHGDHGRHAELDQRRGDAGERVGEAGAGAVARVEHDEAQRRLVGQQARQLAAVELGVPSPVVVLEVQHPVAARREVAMPDVVQHVVRPVAQHLAQPARGRRASASRRRRRRRDTMPATARSTRSRSPATSSGAVSGGLAMTPRMRTAPSMAGGSGNRPTSRCRTTGVWRWLARNVGGRYSSSHGTLRRAGDAPSDSARRSPRPLRRGGGAGRVVAGARRSPVSRAAESARPSASGSIAGGAAPPTSRPERTGDCAADRDDRLLQRAAGRAAGGTCRAARLPSGARPIAS